MSISEQLAAFAAGLSLDQVPDEVTERTKLLLLDTSGIAIRARHDAESTPATIRMVERLGGATGNHAVFGDQKGYGASAAALINGALAHSLDFDDTPCCRVDPFFRADYSCRPDCRRNDRRLRQ